MMKRDWQKTEPDVFARHIEGHRQAHHEEQRALAQADSRTSLVEDDRKKEQPRDHARHYGHGNGRRNVLKDDLGDERLGDGDRDEKKKRRLRP